jgi:serine/threonine-protein phosphatase PP1 catalytic subunit
MEWKGLLEEAERIFEKEPRLIRLPPQGKIVFVGDTHGDLDASQEVIGRYLKQPYRIVFLGDYVDRGDRSEENIHFLLRQKQEHPDEIFLLAGNHEGFQAKEFYPANFWERLSAWEKETYGLLFSKFPLAAASQNGILAIHGGLPDLESLEEIDRIEWGDAHWDRIVWGDFTEDDGDVLGDWGGRPQFGRQYFERMMARYGKQVLIRSHQPSARSLMFEKRCITIFTSNAYVPTRTVAVADMEKEVQRAGDLMIERV